CGLLAGGGYAERVLLNEHLALPIPERMSYEQAAAIPEAFLTAFQALVWLAELQEGEAVLVHAGGSGVGTAAIQLARGLGARVYVTASEPKHPLCLELGADHAIDYRSEDFAAEIRRLTKGRGVQVILDFIGAAYLKQNLEALALDGRLVLLALMGGAKVPDFSLLPLLRKRLKLMGSTLRNRSLEYKIALTHAFKTFAWQGFADGTYRPVIDSVFPWTEVAQAHRRMEANLNQGKIVLRVGDE
ncbi:MAG: NAD(P)H-quinone oxidoreductase, partial [Bacteroidetes bacterium]